MIAQSNGKLARRHLVAGSWSKLVRASRGNEARGMSAVLHDEGAQHCRRIEILGTIHVDCTKSDRFDEFGMKVKNLLTRLLRRPLLAEGKRMSHQGWTRVMKDRNDHVVTIVADLRAFLVGGGINWKHKRTLESKKDVILPQSKPQPDL